MGGIYVEPKDTAFIHMPKCAGTSIRNWLEKERGFHLMPLNKRDIDTKHPTLDIMKKYFDKDKFEYTFVVVRNPYARVISMWRHLIKHNAVPANSTLTEFVFEHADYDTFMRPQSVWFNEDDGVDVLRYETLSKDFQRIKERFNREDDLPFNNRSTTPFSNYENRDVRNHVYDKLKVDFDRFGYEK
jgi:hypothetical protein